MCIPVSLDDLSLEQVMNELSLDTHRKVEENTFVNVVDQVVKELKVNQNELKFKKKMLLKKIELFLD